MGTSEQIETARLILRRPVAGDVGAIFERYASDPDVTRYVGWPRHQSPDATRGFLRFSDAEWETWGAGPYLILSREGGRVLGSSGLAFEATDRASTGYVLAKDAWGHGYATEALRAMVDTARTAGIVRLYALCHPDHTVSAHVLEKCGFVTEGIRPRFTEFPNLHPGVLADVACYAISFERRSRWS